MYISAFLHRDELFEITNRWLSNQLRSEDALQITRIITYDSFVAWERLLQLIGELKEFIPNLAAYKKIATKKELKDFICSSADLNNKRIKQLVTQYRHFPEFFYVGAPIAALAFHDENDRITGMCRFKRVKRIAEKASRYALLHITNEVHRRAAELSRSHQDITSDDTKCLAQAEKEYLLEIKKKGLSIPAPAMAIKDVLGLKIVKNGGTEEAIERIPSRLSGTKIVEKEIHTGDYNAIHYVVELTVDFDYMIERFKNRPSDKVYRARGLPKALTQDFKRFIKSGSNTVQVDLIFTTLEELIESEIGRSMHEIRIYKQRQQQRGFGNITINIEYIIEYLIAVGMSPTTYIEELPVKIWGRYLPDTLSFSIRQLFNLPEYSIIDY